MLLDINSLVIKYNAEVMNFSVRDGFPKFKLFTRYVRFLWVVYFLC